MGVGEEVICLDNFLRDEGEYFQWIDNSRFELIRYDVTEPIKIEGSHLALACPASRLLPANPVKTAKTSFLAPTTCWALPVVKARLLLASTSEVYGDPDLHPQPETYRGRVNQIIFELVMTRANALPFLCFDYQRMHGSEIRIARIFNTYGPRMLADDGRVVSTIVQALRGEPITLYGDGSQSRSFCYVDDLIDGLIRLMNGDGTGPINLGNPHEFSIRQLAEQVRARILSRL